MQTQLLHITYRFQRRSGKDQCQTIVGLVLMATISRATRRFGSMMPNNSIGGVTKMRTTILATLAFALAAG